MQKQPHMSLRKLTERKAVLSAIEECDRIGREAFLKKYLFGEATSYFLEQDGKRYDSKAIVGAAYGYQHGTPLTPHQFSGGESTVMKKLRSLGFTVAKISKGTDRSQTEVQPSRPDWTDKELEAAAEAYLWMLRQEQDGKPYSKAEVNQSLREGALSNRTKASIEYRMQNISAVLDDIRHPRIQGYVPAQNVGEGVKARIRKALEARGFNPSSDYEPTADEAELGKRVSRLRKKKIAAVPPGQTNPSTVETICKTFVRDPVVKAWVLQNAAGNCEACGSPAPFAGDDGEPYLEVHHVRLLASGGSDRTSNSIAVCPNCHRRCHHGTDRVAFTDGLYKRLTRLQKE